MRKIQMPKSKFQSKQKIIRIINNFLKPIAYPLLSHDGFSLIELLVVVALIGMIGAITTQVFILALQTQGKSEIIKEVKQNGDYAMSVMESMIRNSSDILSVSCNDTLNQITIQNPDGFNTIFDCSLGSNNISSISGSENAVPTPTGAPLTNSRVKVSSCTFRVICPTPPINPKYVYIEYTVSQAGSGTGPKDTSTLDYQTTISLRNYQ